MSTSEKRLEITISNTTPSKLQKFFFFCAGVDVGLISNCPRNEWTKHLQVGVAVFSTAILAFLSSSFAINLSFQNIFVSIFLGVVWAYLIFNLDRGIVVGLSKEKKTPSIVDVVKEQDKKKKIILKTEYITNLLQSLYLVTPRMIFAIVIAFTISKPIEILFFGKRIDKQLLENSKQAEIEFEKNERIADSISLEQLKKIDQDRQTEIKNRLNNDTIYANLENTFNKIQQEKKGHVNNVKINDSIKGRYPRILVGKKISRQGKTIFVYGENPLSIDARNRNVLEKREIENLISYESTIKTEMENRRSIRNDIIKEVNSQYDSISKKPRNQMEIRKRTYEQRKQERMLSERNSIDILTKIMALSTISKENRSAWWTSFFFTLILSFIEILPILTKLGSKRGCYEAKCETANYIIQREEELKRTQIDKEIKWLEEKGQELAGLKGQVEIDTEREKVAKQLEINKDLLEEIIKKQKDLAQQYLKAWYEHEGTKVKDNFTAFRNDEYKT
jgi:Domain of unknown function (DUF4407)